ncbi:hypothetical protein BG011_001148 [Mortierella polycephala]|uniref:Uncharacterized protein n=1 Tax=Mortierella polycephala TaxID=41804 RepID=A0A9P6TV73_9FUNG|nr:hypothetical protein BG011_001148 [Mortierella polycephala]
MYVDSIVGWASLVLGIAGLLNPSKVPNAKVRVHLQSGKDIEGLSGAGGHIPTITIKDTSSRYLGQYQPNYLSPATLGNDRYWNYDISTAIPSELRTLDVKMEYSASDGWGGLKMKSLDDGLCLAYMSWTPEDTMFNYRARKGVITGDLFYFCGRSWYPSGKSHESYRLRCGWLDGDNSNGNSVFGMFLNTDILGNGYIQSYSQRYPNPSDICYWGVTFSGGSSPYKKRSTPKDAFGNKAYVTTGTGAIEICDSPTSWGPSMLSLEEGIFCDMVTKTKLPICGRGKKEHCVKYNDNRRSNNGGRGQRTMAANNVSRDDISFNSYDLQYFTISDVNGTVIDDGSDV